MSDLNYNQAPTSKLQSVFLYGKDSDGSWKPVNISNLGSSESNLQPIPAKYERIVISGKSEGIEDWGYTLADNVSVVYIQPENTNIRYRTDGGNATNVSGFQILADKLVAFSRSEATGLQVYALDTSGFLHISQGGQS